MKQEKYSISLGELFNNAPILLDWDTVYRFLHEDPGIFDEAFYGDGDDIILLDCDGSRIDCYDYCPDYGPFYEGDGEIKKVKNVYLITNIEAQDIAYKWEPENCLIYRSELYNLYFLISWEGNNWWDAFDNMICEVSEEEAKKIGCVA